VIEGERADFPRLGSRYVLRGDETGGRVAAKLWWIHVACTKNWTLYHLDERRGKTAMDAAGVLPSFSGIAVHDGLSSYRRYDKLVHALCNSHHQRELLGIAQTTGQDWPTQLADLLSEIHLAVQTAKTTGATRLSARRLNKFRKRYDLGIIEVPISG